MTKIELVVSILNRLHKAVSGSERDFYTDDELGDFAYECIDSYNYDEFTSAETIARAFVNYFSYTSKPCRRCDACGRLMRKGYYYDYGRYHFCSDNCLSTEISERGWILSTIDDPGGYYYNVWF